MNSVCSSVNHRGGRFRTPKLSVHKKDRYCITFLACAIADGSEKSKLMVIGSVLNPRAFKETSGRDLGFDNYTNKMACMTTELFFAWLPRIDQFIGLEPGRKVLLLIDSSSVHGQKDHLPPLQNVRVQFQPPNTTRKVQLLDAGIIAWVKAKYKGGLFLCVFGNIDMGPKSIYNADVLTAMRWTSEAWKE